MPKIPSLAALRRRPKLLTEGGLVLTALALAGTLAADIARQHSAEAGLRRFAATVERTQAPPDGWATRRIETPAGHTVTLAYDPAHALTANVRLLAPLEAAALRVGIGVVGADGAVWGPNGLWRCELGAFGLDAASLPTGSVVLIREEAPRPAPTAPRPARTLAI